MKNTHEFARFLSIATVAAILGISKPSVGALVRRGELPAIRVGHVFRIPETALETYLTAQGLKPGAIYRGTGSPATACPSPARAPAETHPTGATVR